MLSVGNFAGRLRTNSPIRLETIRDVTGFAVIKLINLGLLFAGTLSFLHYMSSSTKHFLDRFATTVRIDDYDTLYHYLLRWMMDHRPPNPRFCSLRAISKSKITWAHEEDALKSVKGDETQDTKFVNYQYIVNQPPISLQSAYSHSKARTSSNIMASGSYSAHCIASKNQYTQLMKDRGYIQLQYIGASVDSLHGLLQEAQSYNPDEITMVTTVYRSICGSETASRWSNFNTRPSRDISAVNIR